MIVQDKIGKTLEKMFLDYFGGYSKFIISGGWFSPAGRAVKENGWMYFILTGMDEESVRSHVEDIVNTIRTETDEEEVLYWFQPIIR